MSSGWLPDLIPLASYGGNWEQYLEAIYAVFKRDFVDSKPVFTGKRMGLKKVPYEKGKEATFWHLISAGSVEADRTIDFERSARIAWPRPVIDAHADTKIRCWTNKRGRENRILLALDDFSYVVVLADRGEYILPWTAYPVEMTYKRDKLRREYEANKVA